MTASFGDRGRGNPLHGLLLVGLAAFVFQMLLSSSSHQSSDSPLSPESSSSLPCMYELIEKGECTGTLFAEHSQSVHEIIRGLGRSDHVKWASYETLVPCGSSLTITEGSCAFRISRIPGSRLVAVGRKIDVNQADAEDLTSVPGIGHVTAQRIVEERERRGGFRSLEELRHVRGIGEKKLAIISEWLEVGFVVQALSRPVRKNVVDTPNVFRK